MTTATETFTGFRPEAIQFLADLAENNDRGLVPASQGRVRAAPQGAARGAVRGACASGSRRAGCPCRRDPARSPFRIYRDVRFSKDKSPYKTSASAAFRWNDGGRSYRTRRATRAATSTSSRARRSSAAGCGIRRRQSSPRSARMLDTDPGRVHAVIDDPAFVTHVRSHQRRPPDPRAAGLPARITPRPSC